MIHVFRTPLKSLPSGTTGTRGIASVLQQRSDNGPSISLSRLGWYARQRVLERQFIVVVYCVYHLSNCLIPTVKEFEYTQGAVTTLCG